MLSDQVPQVENSCLAGFSVGEKGISETVFRGMILSQQCASSKVTIASIRYRFMLKGSSLSSRWNDLGDTFSIPQGVWGTRSLVWECAVCAVAGRPSG
jgi:hypothetical protein